MNVPIGVGAVVAFLVIAELGRVVVAKLFGYQPERHAIPIMKLPGERGSQGFRLALILAGPVTVYLAVAGLAVGFYRCHGQPAPAETATEIGSLVEGTDAHAKLAPGDVLVEVDGARFSGGTAALRALVDAKHGAPLELVVERAGARQPVRITPTQRDGQWVLGLRLVAARDHRLGAALREGIQYPAKQIAGTFAALLELIEGAEEPDAAGPTRLVTEFREAFEVSTGSLVVWVGMLFGTYTLIGLALFDLIRALLLILFRS